TEFGQRVLLVGFLRGRDPDEMLEALEVHRARLVVACPPPSPRALPPDEIATAARRAGVEAVVATDVAGGVHGALAAATEDDMVFVSGSLYLVGAARGLLH